MPDSIRQRNSSSRGARSILIPMLATQVDGEDSNLRRFGPNFGDDDIQDVLKILRIFGFFCGRFYPDTYTMPVGRKWRCFKTIELIFLKLYSAIYVSICLGLIFLNYYIISEMISISGMLHVQVLTAILTGVKPLQGFINLFVFAANFKGHVKCLKVMSHTEDMLVASFRIKRFIIIGICISICLLTFSARLAQYILMGEGFGEFWFLDISLIVVPLLSIWQVLPVLYFIYICSFLHFSFKNLRERLQNDLSLLKQPMKFYYDRFLHLARATGLFTEFLSPVLFFSLGLSVIVLCATIYFMFNADMALQIPTNATEAEIVNIRFIPVWAGAQIVTALWCIFAICIAGLRVNEMK